MWQKVQSVFKLSLKKHTCKKGPSRFQLAVRFCGRKWYFGDQNTLGLCRSNPNISWKQIVY